MRGGGSGGGGHTSVRLEKNTVGWVEGSSVKGYTIRVDMRALKCRSADAVYYWLKGKNLYLLSDALIEVCGNNTSVSILAADDRYPVSLKLKNATYKGATAVLDALSGLDRNELHDIIEETENWRHKKENSGGKRTQPVIVTPAPDRHIEVKEMLIYPEDMGLRADDFESAQAALVGPRGKTTERLVETSGCSRMVLSHDKRRACVRLLAEADDLRSLQKLETLVRDFCADEFRARGGRRGGGSKRGFDMAMGREDHRYGSSEPKRERPTVPPQADDWQEEWREGCWDKDSRGWGGWQEKAGEWKTGPQKQKGKGPKGGKGGKDRVSQEGEGWVKERKSWTPPAKGENEEKAAKGRGGDKKEKWGKGGGREGKPSGWDRRDGLDGWHERDLQEVKWGMEQLKDLREEQELKRQRDARRKKGGERKKDMMSQGPAGVRPHVEPADSLLWGRPATLPAGGFGRSQILDPEAFSSPRFPAMSSGSRVSEKGYQAARGAPQGMSDTIQPVLSAPVPMEPPMHTFALSEFETSKPKVRAADLTDPLHKAVRGMHELLVEYKNKQFKPSQLEAAFYVAFDEQIDYKKLTQGYLKPGQTPNLLSFCGAFPSVFEIKISGSSVSIVPRLDAVFPDEKEFATLSPPKTHTQPAPAASTKPQWYTDGDGPMQPVREFTSVPTRYVPAAAAAAESRQTSTGHAGDYVSAEQIRQNLARAPPPAAAAPRYQEAPRYMAPPQQQQRRPGYGYGGPSNYPSGFH